MRVLAFDVYGTLFDVNSIGRRLGDMGFVELWRRKQLEYTWLLTIMGKWMSFREVTRMALEYALTQYRIDKPVDELMRYWEELEPFSDVYLLRGLVGRVRMYVLTNGDEGMVKPLLSRWGLADLFNGVFTAERVRAYKPSPAIYRTFLDFIGEPGSEVCLVSSNYFDVAGAKNAGVCAIHLNRRGSPPELGVVADAEVRSIEGLVSLFKP
ncbi:haloacid dehalogenase type II [Vulcanisaeta distributa]|uniref:Haloacid dehalogenase, type II n=1 Tax=Vulcanisaeta distributa (strain DSM 14429 / JCM 11212 / NBRC 100878 / IC-017) TaxID=572478 RepID=E1QUF9_VULDI|nr:haloacid dehalogenase type II [Vulcanisaeta distributa]ADN49885.1 haloacid dehalogenase, type II [Vulcanisaeta distributa DSM 14429]